MELELRDMAKGQIIRKQRRSIDQRASCLSSKSVNEPIKRNTINFHSQTEKKNPDRHGSSDQITDKSHKIYMVCEDAQEDLCSPMPKGWKKDSLKPRDKPFKVEESVSEDSVSVGSDGVHTLTFDKPQDRNKHLSIASNHSK